MTDQDRTDIITLRLDRYCMDSLLIGVATPDLDVWPHEGHGVHGWFPPQRTDVGIVFVYQPDMLSLATDTLDDNDFGAFMDALELIIARHVTLLGGGIDDEAERARLIEDEIEDLNPAVLNLLLAVQLAALDGP